MVSYQIGPRMAIRNYNSYVKDNTAEHEYFSSYAAYDMPSTELVPIMVTY